MAIVKTEQLINEHGSAYGWDVEVILEQDESVQSGIDALCEEFGFDQNNESDMKQLHNYGSDVWNQLNWKITRLRGKVVKNFSYKNFTLAVKVVDDKVIMVDVGEDPVTVMEASYIYLPKFLEMAEMWVRDAKNNTVTFYKPVGANYVVTYNHKIQQLVMAGLLCSRYRFSASTVDQNGRFNGFGKRKLAHPYPTNLFRLVANKDGTGDTYYTYHLYHLELNELRG